MNSPFYQIRSTLVFMRRVFGFPLQPKDGSFEEFKFITRIEALRFLFISLLPLAIHLYWFIVFLASDQHLVNLLNLEVFIFKNYSRSKMDIATAVVWALASSTITTAYLILFKRNVKAINTYCSDFSQARSKIGLILKNRTNQVKQKCFKKIESSEKLIIYGQSINLVTTSIITIWMYMLLEMAMKQDFMSEYGTSFQVVSLMLYIFYPALYFYDPMSCTVELIICQVINGLSELLEDWQKILQGQLSNLHRLERDEEKMMHDNSSKDHFKDKKM